MIAHRGGYGVGLIFAASLATFAAGGAALAQAPLYYEDFEDETLEAGTRVSEGTVAGGVVTFDDQSPTARGFVSVVRPSPDPTPMQPGTFAVPLLTFSWDVVEPVFEHPGQTFEMLFRAGPGTGTSSLGSGDDLYEVISYRTAADPTRFDFKNNGNETIFVVYNNKAAPETFASPIDGADVTLEGMQGVGYVKDNEADAWGSARPIANFDTPTNPGELSRFSVGSSSNGNQGGFALDNLLVMPGITFNRAVTNPGVPGDVNGDMLVDVNDFNVIRDHFQQTVTMRTEGDLNRDGFVDFRDYRQWKNNVAPAAEGAAVPETSSVVLALAALGGLSRCRRCRAVSVIS
jgi:hypothetical protein